MEIHILDAYQGKSIEPHISSGCDLVVQLAHGTAAQISGVFIFGICISDGLIDALKF